MSETPKTMATVIEAQQNRQFELTPAQQQALTTILNLRKPPLRRTEKSS